MEKFTLSGYALVDEDITITSRRQKTCTGVPFEELK